MGKMDEVIDTADKDVLVYIVKIVQKRRMKGDKGDWKDFLCGYDRSLGNKLSDPAKRSPEVLAAFLKTFSNEEDLQLFDRLIKQHFHLEKVKQILTDNKDSETPEQGLVRETLEHPFYGSSYLVPSLDEQMKDWIVIKPIRKSKFLGSTKIIAVDCEMVLCEDGTEALVKVCVVGRNLEVKLNELVNPNKAVADYRTEITGVSASDLEGVKCYLADIQRSMEKLLSNGTTLVGHSLYNDLKAMKLVYSKVIDTSFIIKSKAGAIFRRPSLNDLCKAVLGYEVRKVGAVHNCQDDALAAMKLVLARIEGAFDEAILPVQQHVEHEIGKLLLHRIPISVKSEELHKAVPGDFDVEMKPPNKVGGKHYSAFAVFKNVEEACQAYENSTGTQEQDSFGLPQKLVSFQLGTGEFARIYVRVVCESNGKNATRDPEENVSEKKRAFEDVTSVYSKKARKGSDTAVENEAITEEKVCNHLEEIEKLNQLLKEKDMEIESLKTVVKEKEFQISVLDKMVSSLKRKLIKHNAAEQRQETSVSDSSHLNYLTSILADGSIPLSRAAFG